jgi:hypothetical protein
MHCSAVTTAHLNVGSSHQSGRLGCWASRQLSSLELLLKGNYLIRGWQQVLAAVPTCWVVLWQLAQGVQQGAISSCFACGVAFVVLSGPAAVMRLGVHMQQQLVTQHHVFLQCARCHNPLTAHDHTATMSWAI